MTLEQLLFVLSIIYIPLTITSTAIVSKYLKKNNHRILTRFLIVQIIGYLLIGFWALLGIWNRN